MAFQAGMIRQSKEGKMARATGGMAMKIAKEKNDPLYKKYMKIRTVMLKLKEQINQKYGMKAQTAVRQAATKV